MNIADSVKFRNQMDVLSALVSSLAAQMDRIERRLDELEAAKRGPGRPPNKERSDAVR